jgi:hypothetical protein
MPADAQTVIGPYFEAPATCQEYDGGASLVVRQVGEVITAKMPPLIVEHIGSTSDYCLARRIFVENALAPQRAGERRKHELTI